MRLAQPTGARWMIALATVAVTGCAVARVTVDSAAGGGPAAEKQVQPVVMQLAFAPQEDEQDRARQELVSASRALDGTAVFFETDKADLSSEGQVKLRRVAEILRRYPAFRIRIEGNADERGGPAYNFELGRQRACNARDFLVSLKVSPRQVTCVSNGATSPVAPGGGEENWKLNRRNDVVPTRDSE